MSFSQGGGVYCSHCEFEVFLGDSHSFENGGIYLLSFDVVDVHLLSDALEGGLGAQGSHVRSHKTMSVFGDSLKINILS